MYHRGKVTERRLMKLLLSGFLRQHLLLNFPYVCPGLIHKNEVGSVIHSMLQKWSIAVTLLNSSVN